MSGGAMEYCYRHIEDAADYVDDREVKSLMCDLSGLLHDLEWYQSGDYSKEQYLETLSAFKKKWFGGNERNERLKEYINSALDGVKEEVNILIG